MSELDDKPVGVVAETEGAAELPENNPPIEEPPKTNFDNQASLEKAIAD